MNVPTVAELNQLPCSEVCLLLLRCLNTSDLTFLHDLFKPETLEDIRDVTVDLVTMEFAVDGSSELVEFKAELDQIKEAIEQMKSRG